MGVARGAQWIVKCLRIYPPMFWAKVEGALSDAQWISENFSDPISALWVVGSLRQPQAMRNELWEVFGAPHRCTVRHRKSE